MNKLNLDFNFNFTDLYKVSKLKELDQYFLKYLKIQDPSVEEELTETRLNFNSWELKHSKLAINLAFHLEDFISKFFSINQELSSAKTKYGPLARVYECKRLFVQRYALKSKKSPIDNIGPILIQLSKLISSKLENFSIDHFEQIFAENILVWLNEKNQDNLDIAVDYALWACLSVDGKRKHKNGILFKFPHKLDLDNLVPVEEKEINSIKSYYIPEDKCDNRQGFKLTDRGCELNLAVDQVNYCIHCHNQNKDSCSKGSKTDEKGCPLDEKISEMNYLKSRGSIIGSLAMAVIDNPMLAATGHRICNDCMKACIYQKQQPVDIPQVETRVLKDVLSLSWGFEIYSLLTRWNPLSFSNFLPKDDTGAKVLVVGMGPAGFTLAHYLLNEGHIVVGIDGLKIEALDQELLSQPIRKVDQLFEDLDTRVIGGFGGVMEYGITNRWNKNFLLLIRLLLERRNNFKLFGGIRFGSNITPKQAFDMGFCHVALALGAGSPKLLPSIKNGMAKGMRTASDFLMSLQLGKAYQEDSLTNLQIRMPVVVIGGGLTALDTATEALAYYPKLVQKFANKYKNDAYLEEDKIIAEEFLQHNQLFKKSGSLLSSLKSLGGVKILYRGKLQQATSYRLNHEELSLGLSEGVEFVENITPLKIILDQYGSVTAIESIQKVNGEEIKVKLDAKTILIAVGTVPNVILSQEFPEFLDKEGQYFKKLEEKFITYKDDKHSMSFFGDLHPDYAGNVVKAMASAKHGYKIVSKQLKPSKTNAKDFFAGLKEKLEPVLVAINRLAPNIVELIIRSPLSAVNFKPGQFFRLQNYTGDLPLIEALALTGAKIDKESGNISIIILEMGRSSDLCTKLELDKPLVLMGPVGEPTEIIANKKVMLVGGGLGNAVLFSIGQALRSSGSEVLYFAGYRKVLDRYKIEEIEAASNKIIWSCDEELLDKTREEDLTFKGNIVESILNFAQNNPKELQDIDRIIVIGSDRMMHAIKKARHGILKPYLKKNHTAIASINSPMQCMMKEICGQCLQKHIDPTTGVESYVFSCTNQDQEMDYVDFIHLGDRLAQNNLLEKL